MAKAFYRYGHKFLSAPRFKSFQRPALCPKGGKKRLSYHIFTAQCVATLACLLFWWVVSCGRSSNPLKSLELSNSTSAHLSEGEKEEKKIKRQSCRKYSLQKGECVLSEHIYQVTHGNKAKHRAVSSNLGGNPEIKSNQAKLDRQQRHETIQFKIYCTFFSECKPPLTQGKVALTGSCCPQDYNCVNWQLS